MNGIVEPCCGFRNYYQNGTHLSLYDLLHKVATTLHSFACNHAIQQCRKLKFLGLAVVSYLHVLQK